MNLLKDYLKTFLLALTAGICIGIGGTVYIMCSSKLLGAFLFALGLSAILLYKLSLYTGMVGYLFDNKPIYIVKLVVVWLGNFVGTFLVGTLVSNTRLGESFTVTAQNIVSSKLGDNIFSLFILGIFCGILMFLGVDSFKQNIGNKDFIAILMPILCVAVFILCGFEHCIADMFYFAAAGKVIEGLGAVLIITLGNSVGGVIIPLIKKATARL